MEMKLFLSTRIHIPKPRITAPRTWKKKGAVNGVPSQLPLVPNFHTPLQRSPWGRGGQ